MKLDKFEKFSLKIATVIGITFPLPMVYFRYIDNRPLDLWFIPVNMAICVVFAFLLIRTYKND